MRSSRKRVCLKNGGIDSLSLGLHIYLQKELEVAGLGILERSFAATPNRDIAPPNNVLA
jgi:hypothetical protein